MLAVAVGRHGAAVAAFAEVVFAGRVVFGGFGQMRDRSGDVVQHPVHVTVGAACGYQWRVRIVAEDCERTRLGRRAAPRERRGNVFAFTRVLFGNAAVRIEGGAGQLHVGRCETHIAFLFSLDSVSTQYRTFTRIR